MRTRLSVLSALFAVLAVAGLLVLFLPGQAEAKYCENARITDLYTEGYPGGIKGPGFMVLEWSLDIGPWPEDSWVEATYNIHRRPVNNSTWELVDEVNDRTHWEGAPKPGEWVYHVTLVSLRTDGDVETCHGVGAETTLDIPTEAELAPELLAELCERSEVVGLNVVRPGDGTLVLEWEDHLDYFYEDVADNLRHWDWEASAFEADTVVYHIQRSATAPKNTPLGWTTLAETTGRTWTGPAEAGHWTYRVGTIRMTKGDVAVDCEPWYAEAHLFIQTAEEIAEQARQTAVLKAEATRCATETITSDLEGEARQIVAGVVEERVAEYIAVRRDEDHPDLQFHAIVSLAVMLCSEEGPPVGYGSSASPAWTALSILGFADFHW